MPSTTYLNWVMMATIYAVIADIIVVTVNFVFYRTQLKSAFRKLAKKL